MRAARHACALLLGVLVMAPALAQVRVFAAGSLRPPITEAGRAYEQQASGKLQLVFGASGLLRERIAQGEVADVFASANMDHPRALVASGGWQPVRVFARNTLCALAPASSGLTTQNLVARMLDPSVKVGTSTPKADPSGDYAFEMFRRIGTQPGAPAGAAEALEKKALQLTGGPGSPPPPIGRNVYGVLVAEGQADLFITYCTNAVVAMAEQPELRSVTIVPEINVAADYGLTIRSGSAMQAQGFADFLLSAPGRAILAKHGFDLP